MSNIKKILLLMIVIVFSSGLSVSAFAKPKIMSDGQLFDAEYFAKNNPEAAKVLRYNEKLLYEYYINYGKALGKLPYANETKTASESIESNLNSTTSNQIKSDNADNIIINTDNKSTDNEAANSKAIDSKITSNETANSKTVDNKTTDSKSANSEALKQYYDALAKMNLRDYSFSDNTNKNSTAESSVLPVVSKEVSATNFEEDVINSDTPVMVYFWSDNSDDSNAMSPIVTDIILDYGEKIKISMINVDDNSYIIRDYNLKNLPTFIVFDDGEPVKRLSGKTTKDTILKMINKYIK